MRCHCGLLGGRVGAFLTYSGGAPSRVQLGSNKCQWKNHTTVPWSGAPTSLARWANYPMAATSKQVVTPILVYPAFKYIWCSFLNSQNIVNGYITWRFYSKCHKRKIKDDSREADDVSGLDHEVWTCRGSRWFQRLQSSTLSNFNYRCSWPSLHRPCGSFFQQFSHEDSLFRPSSHFFLVLSLSCEVKK